MWRSLQIYHVNVNCTNLDRALTFYEMLGFRNAINSPEREYQGLGLPKGRGRAKLLRLGEDPGGTMLELVEWPDPSTASHPYPHMGIARICIRVEDLPGMVAHLRSHGIEIISDTVSAGLKGGEQEFVCIYDPDGTVLELTESLQ